MFKIPEKSEPGKARRKSVGAKKDKRTYASDAQASCAARTIVMTLMETQEIALEASQQDPPPSVSYFDMFVWFYGSVHAWFFLCLRMFGMSSVTTSRRAQEQAMPKREP